MDDHHYEERKRGTFANNSLYFSSYFRSSKPFVLPSSILSLWVWSLLQAVRRFHQYKMSARSSTTLFWYKTLIGSLIIRLALKQTQLMPCFVLCQCAVDMNHSERSGLLKGRREQRRQKWWIAFSDHFHSQHSSLLYCVNVCELLRETAQVNIYK